MVVTRPASNQYVTKVPSMVEKEGDLEKLIKIKKIVKHSDLHGQEEVKDIAEKIKRDCTSD